jgi:hypothetical protein
LGSIVYGDFAVSPANRGVVHMHRVSANSPQMRGVARMGRGSAINPGVEPAHVRARRELKAGAAGHDGIFV